MIDLGGRPTKFNDIVVQKLEEAFSIGASIPEACMYANISKQTYYNWEKENKELFDRFDELKQKPIIKARRAVVNGLDDPEFALKYLSKKKRDEFGDNIDITTQGEKIDKINVHYIDELRSTSIESPQGDAQASG
jgi:DNA-binding XRE family transcriptional regulator